MPQDRPNFIVVTTDQQRYDTLGVTGNDIVKTPHFDALAGRGTLFTRAYTQNPVCIPSRACLHTGRYCHQHGVQYMEAEIDTTPPLPPWETTFMERLQGAGYRTGAVGKIHMMEPKGYHEMQLTGGKGARWTQQIGQDIGPAPLGQAYAAWLEKKRPGAYEDIYEQRRRPEYKDQRGAIINCLDEDEYVDYWAAEMAIEFLQRRDGSEPWMLWVGFCGPHGPADPPRHYAEMYDIAEMPVPYTWLCDCADKPEFMRRKHVPADISPQDRLILQRWHAYYYAEMTFIDDMIGRILEQLHQQGFADDTIVITTSDHGEMLGHLGRWGKGNFLEQVTRMPTIVSLPGGNPVREFPGLVENFRIAPTVLDYAGVAPPPEMTATSLRPILEGNGEAQESALCEYVDNFRQKAGACVRTERYKYARWTNIAADYPYTGELYDMANDPEESRNLWHDPDYAQVRRELAELLSDRFLTSQEPAYTSWLHQPPEHVLRKGQE